MTNTLSSESHAFTSISAPSSFYSALSRTLQRVARSSTAVRRHAGKSEDLEKVIVWARESFEAEVQLQKTEATIGLAKAGMLIALEEEAAAEAFHANNPPLMEQAVQRHIRLKGTKKDRQWMKTSGISEAPILWDLGTSPTWNLTRLDGMAAEVSVALKRSCGLDDWAAEDSLSNTSGTGVTGSKHAASSHEASTSGRSVSYCAQKFPMLAIAAVNEVLFEQQGYKRMPAHGDPRDSYLPQVIERGCGSPAALAILYIEICQRLGLPMSATLLDDGRYSILWPTEVPLQLAGEEVVVDVYSGGELYLLKEIRQLFSLPPGPLQPASKRELLRALLCGLRDVHWSKAVGCQPEPGLLLPLAVATALSGAVPVLQGFQIERAIAAAERALFLAPQDRDMRVKLAVLLFFGARHGEALALIEGESQSELASFSTKLRLMQKVV